MSIKGKANQLVDELPTEDLRVVARILRGLRAPAEEPDAEARAWLDADLVEDLAPHDWKGVDPLSVGDAIRYQPLSRG